jgi:hypothetical protein
LREGARFALLLEGSRHFLRAGKKVYHVVRGDGLDASLNLLLLNPSLPEVLREGKGPAAVPFRAFFRAWYASSRMRRRSAALSRASFTPPPGFGSGGCAADNNEHGASVYVLFLTLVYSGKKAKGRKKERGGGSARDFLEEL